MFKHVENTCENITSKFPYVTNMFDNVYRYSATPRPANTERGVLQKITSK